MWQPEFYHNTTMDKIFVVYDTDDAMRGIFKEPRRAEAMLLEEDGETPRTGWYITELKTDLFGVLEGDW